MYDDAGDLLELTSARLQGIDSHHQGDVRQCCREVLIDRIKNGSPHYPPTWDGLIKLLINLELSSIADTLKLALKMSNVVFFYLPIFVLILRFLFLIIPEYQNELYLN